MTQSLKWKTVKQLESVLHKAAHMSTEMNGIEKPFFDWLAIQINVYVC